MGVPTICSAISMVCLQVLLSVLLLPRRNRSLGLGSLCRCCIPVSPDVSSSASVLVQHCPCLVPDDHITYVAKERHCGSMLQATIFITWSSFLQQHVQRGYRTLDDQNLHIHGPEHLKTLHILPNSSSFLPSIHRCLPM
jgi:hypothetical protein